MTTVTTDRALLASCTALLAAAESWCRSATDAAAAMAVTASANANAGLGESASGTAQLRRLLRLMRLQLLAAQLQWRSARSRVLELAAAAAAAAEAASSAVPGVGRNTVPSPVCTSFMIGVIRPTTLLRALDAVVDAMQRDYAAKTKLLIQNQRVFPDEHFPLPLPKPKCLSTNASHSSSALALWPILTTSLDASQPLEILRDIIAVQSTLAK